MSLTRKQVRILNLRLYVRSAVGTVSMAALAFWPTWTTIVCCLSLVWVSQFIVACLALSQEMVDSDVMVLVFMTLLVGATVFVAVFDDGNDALKSQAWAMAFLPLAALFAMIIYLCIEGIITGFQSVFKHE